MAVNPDIAAERTINPAPFTDFIYTPQKRRIHEFVKDLLVNNDAFKSDMHTHENTRDEDINAGFRTAAEIFRLVGTKKIELGLDSLFFNEYTLYHTGHGLHLEMFAACIKDLGNKVQRAKWLELAYDFKIMGCYAQTEMGHGSDVQNLETTATFDPSD
jgi:acyl-CoA oxidase